MNRLPWLPLLATAGVCLIAGLALGALRLRHATAEAEAEAEAANRSPIACAACFTDQDGAQVRLADYRGQALLIYFGYTFCPDICPTELGYMARLLDALGARAGRLIPVFISVDPERDTPDKLAPFAALFHPRLRAWWAPAAELRTAAAAFGVSYDRVQPALARPGFYLINHTSTIYLVDAAGRLLGTMDSHTPLEEALALLRTAL